MNLKIAVVLLGYIVLASTDSSPELKSGTGLFPRQDSYPYQRQPGTSSIFGWLGSRLARIPQMFRPRSPQYPNFKPSQHTTQYQSNVVLPDPPSQNFIEEGPEEEDEEGQDDGNQDFDHAQAYPPQSEFQHAQSLRSPNLKFPQQRPVQQGPPPIEVVQSQMISYNHHQHQLSQPRPAFQQNPQQSRPAFQQNSQQFNGGQFVSPSAASPVVSPPLRNFIPHSPAVKQYVKNVPVIPFSTGPDYFDTAYNSPQAQQGASSQSQYKQVNYQQQGQQNSGVNVQKGLGAETNYGATFQDIQHKPVVYDSSVNFGAIGSPIIQSSGQHIENTNGQFGLGQVDLSNQDLGSLLSSLDTAGPPYSGDRYSGQASQNAPTITRPAQQNPTTRTPGYEPSGLPGVQILSQSVDGGNPVFELLADADAPSYDGHPFDINKLIAMIEPGAQIDQAPQLSQTEVETKNVYQEETGHSPTSGTDLLNSESAPEPTLAKIDGSITKKPFFPILLPDQTKYNSSSLKEIMQFFQYTGGKGYVIVEKKRSRTPDDQTDFDDEDDLTDGLTRINITSENLPLLELAKDTGRTNVYNIIRNYSKQTGNKYSNNPKLQRPFNSLSSVTTTSKPQTSQFAPTVFFAVRATTQNPNHNYGPSSSTTAYNLNNNFSPSIFFDSIISKNTKIEDLETEETQVHSIAITVTPPPNLKFTRPTSTTTTTSPVTSPSTLSPELLFNKPNPITKTNLTSETKKGKSRPAPVFLGKANKNV